ncbi:BnaA08g06280D [Brassica napus]|uniref:BnaA08g06280D protein n=1 Tax=Brassica napus TaxID=3708 RepID=A0A078HVW4_BRANA|nr:BnaA08g06280D [Brassica napus]
MDQSSNLPAFPASFVGGRLRPRRLFADPFSSLVPSWGNFPEADEAVPMAPLRQRRSLFPDNDDGGMNEIAISEAGFRGFIPSLIAKVSACFGFAPSQLTPLSWRTLITIRVLGEFHGIPFGVSEVLYSYYFAPLIGKKGFYHIRSRDGRPLRSVGNALCLPISAVYDDYHKAKTWRMHPYPPSIPSIDSMADSSSSLSTALSTTLGRTPASGSPLGGTPVPRYEVLRVRSQRPPPSPGKRKLPIRRTLRLYKGNLNPRAKDRHFKT